MEGGDRESSHTCFLGEVPDGMVGMECVYSEMQVTLAMKSSGSSLSPGLDEEEHEGILDLVQIRHLDFLILKPCYITRLQELEDVG